MLTKNECLDYKEFVTKYQYYLYPLLVDQILAETPLSDAPIVVDGGTGPGFLTMEFLKKTSAKVHAIDYSPYMLDIAKATLTEFAMDSTRVSFDLKDIHNTGFPDQYADLIVSYSCMHHWARPAEVLRELFRITKNGGSIYILDTYREATDHIVPSMRMQMPEDHLFRFVEEAFEESFSLDKVEQITKNAGISDYQLELFSFSEEILVNNLELLESLPLQAESEQSGTSTFCLKIRRP